MLRTAECGQHPTNAVPDLTPAAGIKLNERPLLLCVFQRIALHDAGIACHGEAARRPKVGLFHSATLSSYEAAGGIVGDGSMCTAIDPAETRISKSADTKFWNPWTVILPRRSITGRLVRGRVWRRLNGRRWQYKQFIEYDENGE